MPQMGCRRSRGGSIREKEKLRVGGGQTEASQTQWQAIEMMIDDIGLPA
jgi:hypothetical protein